MPYVTSLYRHCQALHNAYLEDAELLISKYHANMTFLVQNVIKSHFLQSMYLICAYTKMYR